MAAIASQRRAELEEQAGELMRVLKEARGSGNQILESLTEDQLNAVLDDLANEQEASE